MSIMTKKIFQNLHGTWRLSRDISGSHIAHATGIAVFKKTTRPDELRYSEDVEMTTGEGVKLNGYQHYIYRLEEGHQLKVYFDGGERLFHAVECNALENSGEHKASHYCQPDTYITSYFFGERQFQIEHQVRGPKKNYRSYTTYQKIESK